MRESIVKKYGIVDDTFENPSDELIEYLKQTKGTISGSFALSMLLKTFNSNDIDIFSIILKIFLMKRENISSASEMILAISVQ